MKYTYITKGVCSTKIDIELDGDTVKDVVFTGGCNGNLRAVSTLIKGMPISYVREKLSGNLCGHKNTSCADQLVKGIDEALKKSAK